MKRQIACVLLLALLQFPAAQAEQNDSSALTVSLPPENEQILGDDSTAQTREVTLYYASENETELSSVTRRISVPVNGSLIECVLGELLGNNAVNRLRPAVAESALCSVEFGSGVATVDLSVETAANLSEAECFRLCVSIANTLLGLDEVEAVNILIGGQSYAVHALPLGTFTQQIPSVSAAYAQIQAEAERYSAETGSVSRSIVLYFPSQTGGYFLPEARSISFDTENCLNAVLNALMDGPQVRQCCYSPIPRGVDYLLEMPVVNVSGAGERLITLNFSATLSNYLAFAGIEPWQLYGSAALTLLSFYPETAAVRILIDGAPAVVNAGTVFSDGVVYRSDFASLIGSSAQFYYASDGSGLVRLEAPMSQAASGSALSILREMISSGDPDIEGLRSVFPAGIEPEDILGVALDGRIATVNLSANFYAHCQSLSDDGEHLLIYAMVNALCELRQIGAVGFRVEGELFESLSGEIYMKSSLLPDPGLIDDNIDEE